MSVWHRGILRRVRRYIFKPCSLNSSDRRPNTLAYWKKHNVVGERQFCFSRFCFVTTGNIVLIIVCNKVMWTVPNMYILNLALSDIIYLTAFFSEVCVNRMSDTWLDGDFMLLSFHFVSPVSRSVSLLCSYA